ncbi:MAG: 23S rRNA (pseudouridine(1915)-N(3))-methyltransferase RlmH [Lachnospiraceae bacterium]|nr:23S rRNA (pseudouridine(1915)-N(3))-methyltransferase RlmH [Lachnospiraceae bacterium]
MNITIVCVGKIKEKYFTDAISEYSKRLSKYIKLIITEVGDEKTPQFASDREEEIIRDKEGERILKAIPKDAFKVALCIDGKAFDSPGFSKYIENLQIQGVSHICFIIGGSLGLSQSVLNACNFKVSFSKMTFPHQLMRVILLEQVYRAYRIMKNEPYHK